jgi:hypothetical protein
MEFNQVYTNLSFDKFTFTFKKSIYIYIYISVGQWLTLISDHNTLQMLAFIESYRE